MLLTIIAITSGFQVSEGLLQRAFEETYCLKLDDIFSNYDLALGTYRRSVGYIIPKMTKVAWQTKKDEIMKGDPSVTRRKFLYHLSRASYYKNWGGKYQSPSFGEKLLALFIAILPKIGPLRALSFRMPTPQTENMFMASFNGALQGYQRLSDAERNSGHVDLVNDNFDTGSVTSPGQYPLADRTYADLVDRLAKNHFVGINAGASKATLLDYYRDPNAPVATKKNRNAWTRVQQEIADLRTTGLAQNTP